MTRVLVIEDDQATSRALCMNLRVREYEARATATGSDGLALAGRFPPDAILMAADLPDMSGVEVVSGLRRWTSAPIIVLSDHNAEVAKILFLDAGADDYVVKPFGTGELLARLRAKLRRSRPTDVASIVETEDFSIDLARKCVTSASDREIHLTSTEWRLVEVLVRSAGKVVTQRALLQQVWGPSYGTETQYLRVYLKQIRSKLEPDPGRPRHFLTHPGFGLRFEVGDNSRAHLTAGTARTETRRTMTPLRLATGATSPDLVPIGARTACDLVVD